MCTTQGNFSDYLVKLATTYGLETWDWVAICISITSLLVAGFTLYSQLKTQINTTSCFTKSSQRLVITNIIYQLLEAFCKICAIQVYMRAKKNVGYFIRRILYNLHISTDQLHLELTYDSDQKYMAFSSFKDQLDKYNDMLVQLQANCENRNIQGKVILLEFLYLKTQIRNLIQASFSLLKDIFNDKRKYSEILEGFINEMGINKDPGNIHHSFGIGLYSEAFYMTIPELHEFMSDPDYVGMRFNQKFVDKYKQIRKDVDSVYLLENRYFDEAGFTQDEYISSLAFIGTLYSQRELVDFAYIDDSEG